jgi:hypothetical protein
LSGGERNLSFKKLCAIAQTLGCDVVALTRGLLCVGSWLMRAPRRRDLILFSIFD